MDYTIVYKTYKNDLDWLKYSLMSIKKYISNIPEIVIYYHDQCKDELHILLDELNIDLKYRLIPVEYDINGYLKQMVIKCMCFKDITTDYILIMDCDVILNNFFNITDLINDDGKINWYLLHKNESNKNDDQWRVWEKSIKNMVNEDMNTFYMYNGFPFLFKKETLEAAYYHFLSIHGLDYNEFCKRLLNSNNVSVNDPITGPDGKFEIMATIFEEFEYLGWYSSNHTNDYKFIEGPNSLSIRSQFWSHGGLTPEIKNEIEIILK